MGAGFVDFGWSSFGRTGRLLDDGLSWLEVVRSHVTKPMDQYQELAARYKDGPYWAGDDAQAFGRGFNNDLDNARDALR